MSIDLYFGSAATKIKGDRVVLNGLRCASAKFGPGYLKHNNPDRTSVLLDSGAFSDAPNKRLNPEEALKRQIDWESKVAHIFGSLYLPCLGGALWLCDRHKICLSVDSSRPLLDHTRSNLKRSKARGENWRESVVWWKNTLSNLRASEYYQNPFRFQQLEIVFGSPSAL